MPNMKQLIMAHNRRILKNNKENKLMCNCRKQEFFVDGKFFTENLIYKATVKI